MAYDRKKLYILDGYNIIRSGNRYKKDSANDYTQDFFNLAREKLINDVQNFVDRNSQAIIVFDGGNNPVSDGTPEKIGGVRVIFSPANTTADKVIEKLARQARNRNQETIVISSDAAIQDTVFGGGIDRMSANNFSWEVDFDHQERLLDAKVQVNTKNTLAQRIDATTLAKLQALRDGNSSSKK